MLMLKQKFLLCFILLFPAFFLSARTGLGGAFSYSLSTEPHTAASFSVRTDFSPWSLLANVHFNENTLSLFFDNWFVNERLAEHADYFLLWGMSFGSTFEENDAAICTGARFGAGFDFFFLNRRLETFVQAVWNPYLGLKKKDGDYAPVLRPVNFPCSAGLRIWF